MFCYQCGQKLPDQAKFCAICGTAVAPPNPPQGSPSQTASFSPPKPQRSYVQKVLETVTGDTGEPAITFPQLFADVFKKHDKKDLDDLLLPYRPERGRLGVCHPADKPRPERV